jgi:hypothetical protein
VQQWCCLSVCGPSSIGSSGLVSVIRAPVPLLHHLLSIYNVSERLDSPDSTLTCSRDLVGPSVGTDSSRFRLELSTGPLWVDIIGERPGVTRRWYGWPRYVCHRALVPLLLTFFCSASILVSSRFDSRRALSVVHGPAWPKAWGFGPALRGFGLRKIQARPYILASAQLQPGLA